MSLLDLTCKESLYITKNCCYSNKKKDCLLLGSDCINNYIIYLYFNLPPYSYLKYLKQAKLVLFKLPMSNTKNCTDEYSIYPCSDFFNFYSCTFSTPSMDYSHKVTFNDKDCYSYTEVDITCILKAWIEDKIENKGLFLLGDGEAHVITYASNQHDMNGMRPMIRLTYDENFSYPIFVTTPCMVNVG